MERRFLSGGKWRKSVRGKIWSAGIRASPANKMDAMSLSLDDIIKKKSIGKRPKPGGGAGKNVTKVGRNGAGPRPGKKPLGSPNGRRKGVAPAVRGGILSRVGIATQPRVVVDARMKIIQKKRAQIRDARDKLVEIARNSGDARLRLLKRKGKVPPPGNGILKKRSGGTPVPSSE